MLRRLGIAGVVGAALVAAATAFAPAAHANGNVGFSVSIGAPGFAATVGNPPWAAGYVAPYYAPYYYRPYYAPAPVVIRRWSIRPPTWRGQSWSGRTITITTIGPTTIAGGSAT